MKKTLVLLLSAVMLWNISTALAQEAPLAPFFRKVLFVSFFAFLINNWNFLATAINQSGAMLGLRAGGYETKPLLSASSSNCRISPAVVACLRNLQNVSSRSCETLLRGNLVARFYYIYALDYDRGGEWSGQAFMCSRDKEFTIKGTENCLARGFDRTGFFEVDTGEQRSWTVQLTEANEQPSQRVPGIPGTVGPGGPGLPGMPNPPAGAPGLPQSPGSKR